MKRNIVKIDQEKCNGCGLCINACHEQAIVLNENGKAELIKDDYCDGLGDCLPACPVGAIEIIQREAAPYDEKAVKERIAKKEKEKSDVENKKKNNVSRLSQWPVQIKLAPTNAEYFNGADLLIAADCTAYAYANFHDDFIKDRIVLVGCPKLDSVDYSEKLAEILKENDIKSVTVVRMQVPCCGGMEFAFKKALEESKKMIPTQVITLSLEGEILK